MISVFMMKQKNVIEQLRFAYDFLIAVSFSPWMEEAHPLDC